jgi:molybdenum cofactor cytidylyltransferase
VVLGHEAGRVQQALAGFDVRFVENPDFALGMTSSIQAGVRAALPASAGYLIALSDMPRLSAETPAAIVATFRAAEAHRPGTMVIPMYQGQRGHPVVFSATFREEILAHHEPEGCRGIVKRHADRVVEVLTEDEGAVWDVDRPSEFKVKSEK